MRITWNLWFTSGRNHNAARSVGENVTGTFIPCLVADGRGREKLSSLGLRPASSILARRIVFPLLFLGAGLVLVQPCAGAPFQFEETGSLATARYSHTATLLPNGKVLVAGGDNGGALASAELYDPASGTWTATGSLATARDYHTATLLPNGKVLVAGGLNDSSAISRARNSTIRRAGPGRPPAASPPHAIFTRRRCCPTARCSSQAVTAARRLSRERGTLRSGERDLDGHRQPRHRTLWSHGDVAAQRQGARRRRCDSNGDHSRERGTLRSGERDLDGHRQPRHRTRWSHGDVAAQRQGARRRRF